MLLNNRLTTTIQMPQASEEVIFNTLKPGDRFTALKCKWVDTIFFKCDDYITVKREDGWLVRAYKGGFIWNRMVLKVNN
jgi:hypothetical protein